MSDALSGSAPAIPDETIDSAILRLLMETIPDRIYFKDLESRFVRVNASHARFLGAPNPESVVGKNDFDFFSPEHAARALAGEREIIRTGVPILGRVEAITKRDGSHAWGSTTKMPWRNASGAIIGTFGLTRDVTAAKQAEEKLAEEHNLLQTIIDHLPSRIFVKDQAGRYVTNNAAHLRWLGVARPEDARGRTSADFFPGPRAEQAAADDRRVLSGEGTIISQEKSDLGPEGEAHWWLATKVPLRDLQGRIVALVGISTDITERKRTEQELRRRSAEMEADLKMARQLQEAFLSRAYPVFPSGSAPELSRLRFDHRYVPAAKLGGDFFDIAQLSDSRCGILICDVMGHGVRAGLLTALIRGAVDELGERAADPAHVLAEINRGLLPIIRQTGQPVFATAFYGVFDLDAGTLTYSNAGHPPAFVVRRGSGSVRRLAFTDPEPAAGLVEAFRFSRAQCEFLPGDCFLGYTDGVVEASDPHGAFFGEDRLREALGAAAADPQADLLRTLLASVENFTGRTEFEDDLCLVAVTRSQS